MAPGEVKLHKGLWAWANNHASRYPAIEPVPLDLSKHPDQRINQFKTESPTPLSEEPDEEVIERLRSVYLATLGETAAAALDAFEKQPAYEGEPAPVAAVVKELLEQNKSVALLTSHAEDLSDIGTYAGGLAVSMASKELVGRNGTILNKAMTRESYLGTPIAEILGYYANIYWVIPETDSTKTWQIPKNEADYINSGSMRALRRDMAEGVAVSFAPSASAMAKSRKENGQPVLVIPKVAEVTAKLITRFDAFIPMVVWGDQVGIGDLEFINRPRGLSAAAQDQFTEATTQRVMQALGSQTESLAGVEVEYAEAA